MSKFYLIARAISTTKAAPVFAPSGARPPTLSAALTVCSPRRSHYPLGHAAARLMKDAHILTRQLSHPIKVFAFHDLKLGVERHYVSRRAWSSTPTQQSALGRLKSLGRFFVGGSPVVGGLILR